MLSIGPTRQIAQNFNRILIHIFLFTA